MKNRMMSFMAAAILLTLSACNETSSITPSVESAPTLEASSSSQGASSVAENADNAENTSSVGVTPDSSEKEESMSKKSDEELLQIIALSDALNGVYSGSTFTGEPLILEVFSVGGGVVLEYSVVADGEVTDFWAEEFWPDDFEALYNPTLTTVTGKGRTFSAMSGEEGYQQTEANRMITLTGDALTLGYMEGTSETYQRADKESGVHAEPSVHFLRLTHMYEFEKGKGPVGVWGYTGETRAAWLSLKEDGSLYYAAKKSGEPMEVMIGAWGVDPAKGNIHFLGEKIGSGNAPQSFELTWRMENGDLVMDEEIDEAFLPTSGEVTFQPSPADWRFPSYLGLASEPETGGAAYSESVANAIDAIATEENAQG